MVDTAKRNITVVGAGFMGTVIATLYGCADDRIGNRSRASGIGNASARQLLAAGHEVVAVDLDAQAVRASLKTSCEELEPVSADISREEDCRAAAHRAISRFGKIDAVLHWAAKHSRTYWSELTAEEFNRRDQDLQARRLVAIFPLYTPRDHFVV